MYFSAISFGSSQFQSTPSAWRVTIFRLFVPGKLRISIHTLRVEGDVLVALVTRRSTQISIHTLRVEGDSRSARASLARAGISIHTLRVEGDVCLVEGARAKRNFNPHPPRGG